jgi:hypothetical protein
MAGMPRIRSCGLGKLYHVMSDMHMAEFLISTHFQPIVLECVEQGNAMYSYQAPVLKNVQWNLFPRMVPDMDGPIEHVDPCYGYFCGYPRKNDPNTATSLHFLLSSSLPFTSFPRLFLLYPWTCFLGIFLVQDFRITQVPKWRWSFYHNCHHVRY